MFQVRQERKKLDFDNMDLLVSPSLNIQRPTPLRRCFSMVETKNLQLKTVNSSPEMTKFCDEDMTSPLSRPFASFKRPNAPLQPLNNLDIVQQPCKKIRRGFSLKENRNEMRSESRNFDDHLNKSASTSMLDSPQIAKPMLQLSLSESENIKRACSLAGKSSTIPNLKDMLLMTLIVQMFPIWLEIEVGSCLCPPFLDLVARPKL